MNANVILAATNIRKSFGGTTALKGVSFEVLRGEILGLVGENGAGKSTLMRILSGIISPDSDGGHIEVDGASVHFRSPIEAQRHGIAMIPQELLLVDQLTVEENIFLGHEPLDAFGRIEVDRRRALTHEVLSTLGCTDIDPRVQLGLLSKANQQLVAIARRLVQGGQVFIMDEPTAALTEAEAQNLFRVIREQICPRGYAVVFISHRLEEVLTLCDRVIVLRDGERVATLEQVSLSQKDELVRQMVGKAIEEEYPKSNAAFGAELLELKDLSYLTAQGSLVCGLNVSVRRGEVVGVTGLAGVGKTELGQVIIGLRPARAGSIRMNGVETTGFNPKQTCAVGIGYVSEDRRGEGLILDLSSMHNMTLSAPFPFRRGRWLVNHRLERERTAEYAHRMVMKPRYVSMDAGKLSGGNQQKIVIIRQLIRDAALIVLDEPTKGIDIGAKSEIAQLVGELSRSGKAVLLLSSEPREVLGLSDTIVVLTREGMRGPFARGTIDYDTLMALQLGANIGGYEDVI